jgi:hypothetical protein
MSMKSHSFLKRRKKVSGSLPVFGGAPPESAGWGLGATGSTDDFFQNQLQLFDTADAADASANPTRTSDSLAIVAASAGPVTGKKPVPKPGHKMNRKRHSRESVALQMAETNQLRPALAIVVSTATDAVNAGALAVIHPGAQQRRLPRVTAESKVRVGVMYDPAEIFGASGSPDTPSGVFPPMRDDEGDPI